MISSRAIILISKSASSRDSYACCKDFTLQIIFFNKIIVNNSRLLIIFTNNNTEIYSYI